MIPDLSTLSSLPNVGSDLALDACHRCDIDGSARSEDAADTDQHGLCEMLPGIVAAKPVERAVCADLAGPGQSCDDRYRRVGRQAVLDQAWAMAGAVRPPM